MHIQIAMSVVHPPRRSLEGVIGVVMERQMHLLKEQRLQFRGFRRCRWRSQAPAGPLG
jgi:hypothetical protein